jgi:hypothetical protein
VSSHKAEEQACLGAKLRLGETDGDEDDAVCETPQNQQGISRKGKRKKNTICLR